MNHEFDLPAATLKGVPKALEALIDLGFCEDRLWRAEDLASIFRHQLAAPLRLDLEEFEPASADRVRCLSLGHVPPLVNFGDLFGDMTPPRSILVATKNFAKANLVGSRSAIPKEIASALYYLSIAAALVRLGIRISRLSNADLRKNLMWIKAQPWIDEASVRLLEDALASISPKSRGAGPGS